VDEVEGVVWEVTCLIDFRRHFLVFGLRFWGGIFKKAKFGNLGLDFLITTSEEFGNRLLSEGIATFTT
jgi:hypothetical protein